MEWRATEKMQEMRNGKVLNSTDCEAPVNTMYNLSFSIMYYTERH